MAHRFAQTVQRQERQRIRTDPFVHLVKRHVRRNQLIARVGVDAVEARPHHLRAGDTQVHLGSARIAQHLHQLLRGVAAYDAVVDDHQALARDHIRERIQLQADAQLAHLLRGLDERAAHIAVLHDAIGVFDTALRREAKGRGHTGVGHTQHQIGLDRCLARQDASRVAAGLVHALPVDHTIGPREVHVFEDARGRRSGAHRLFAAQAVLGEAHDLARVHIAHVFGTHDIQPARLGADHPAASVGQLPDAQRPDAMRVTECIERVSRGYHHGVCTAHQLHSMRDAVAQMMRLARHHADGFRRHFAIGARPQLHTLIDQARAHLVGVGQSAIVGQREQHIVDG